MLKEGNADSTSEEKTDVTDNVTDNMFLKLTERQKKICILLAKDTSLPASAMSELLSVSLRTVKRDLATLQEKGILIREGKAKNGRWVIVIPKKETNE